MRTNETKPFQETKFILERLKLLRLQHLWKYFPNLASETSLSIYPSIGITGDDDGSSSSSGNLKNEKNNRKYDLVVKTRFERIGCEMVSCNPYYPVMKTCSTNDAPLTFSNNANKNIPACQPSCKLFKPTTTVGNGDRNKSNTGQNVDSFSPFTVWNDGKCYVEDANLLAFIVDYSRRNEFDDEQGLDFKAEFLTDSTGRKYISGRINESYCEAHGMDYVDEKINYAYDGIDPVNAKRCELTAGKYLSSWFIGSSLTKLVSRWHNGKIPNNTLYTVPQNKYILDEIGWKNHRGPYNYETLNVDVSLSDFDIVEDKKDRYWTNKTIDSYLTIKEINDGRVVKHTDTDRNDLLKEIYIDNDGEEEDFENVISNTGYRDDKSLNEYIDIFSQNVYNLYLTLLDSENVTNVTIGEVSEITLNNIKSNIKSTAKSLINRIVDNKRLQVKLINDFGSRVLNKQIINKVVITMVAERIAFTMGRTVAAISKLSVAATNVVGWLLIIGPIMDIIFSFWDPLKLATQPYSDLILYKISSELMKSRRRTYNRTNIELDPILFWINYARPSLDKNVQEELLAEEIYTIHKYILLFDENHNNNQYTKEGENVGSNDLATRYTHKLVNYAKTLNVTRFQINKNDNRKISRPSTFLVTNPRLCFTIYILIIVIMCAFFVNSKTVILTSVVLLSASTLYLYLKETFSFRQI